jgi:parallel beta-helix repeat protein
LSRRAGCRLAVEILEPRCLPTTVLMPPLHLDFGNNTSPVAPGYTGVPLVAYSAQLGYGWQSVSGMTAANRGTMGVQLGTDNTFLVNVPNGWYNVTATLGDPKYSRNPMALWADGQEVASGLATAAGQFLEPTFGVDVTNGQFALTIAGSGGTNPYFAICSLDIVPSATGGSLTSLYVSTSGSDSNNGLTASTAFRTLAAACAHATYGMTVYIGAGTYQEPLLPQCDGAQGQGITFTSYNGPVVIDGSTQTWVPGSNQNQGLVELRHPYLTIDGLTITNSPDTGIVLGANDLTVEGCTVSNTQRHGISTDTKFQAVSPGTGTVLQNITLENNTVSNVVLKGQGAGQAISLCADGFLVSGTTVEDSMTEGIDIWLGARHGEVTGNTVLGNHSTGIYVDGAAYIRIDANTVYNNGAGIGVSSENPNYATHDIWVFNNVVHDNAGAGIYLWDSPTNPGFHGSQNVLITNNTLVNNKTSIYLAGDGNTAQIMNNLCYTTGKQLFNVATKSTFSIHNNVYLADLSGFVSAATFNYQLLPTSPAIDQGAPIPTFSDDLGNIFTVATDFAGQSRVVNGLPDAGAFEYQG